MTTDYVTCGPPTKPALLWEAQLDHFHQMAAVPRLVRDAVRGVARVRRRSKERSDHPDLAKMFKAPPTFLNHVVSPVRTFATASVSLAEVKETAKQLGVTFNDIILAIAAGGLRELLLRYDGRADRPIMASVPVSTNRSADRITGNEIRRIVSVAAGAHRRSAGTGPADVSGDLSGQGRLRADGSRAAGQDDGISATSGGADDVSMAVKTRRTQ